MIQAFKTPQIYWQQPDTPSSDEETISDDCVTCPKVYASFYYIRHPDHSSNTNLGNREVEFSKCSRTFLNKIKENFYAGYWFFLKYKPQDLMVEYWYHDEATFVGQWRKLMSLSEQHKVAAVSMFGHHGLDPDGNSYISGRNIETYVRGEHAAYGNDPSNLHGDELSNLEVLNWHDPKESFIFMSNCNGNEGTENVAGNMHNRQGVTTITTKAYASFSREWDKYSSINGQSFGSDTYLLAFNGRSNLWGDDKDEDASWLRFSMRIPEAYFGSKVWTGIE